MKYKQHRHHFDGWSTSSTYYVGIYAIYVIADTPLLAPLFEENAFGADLRIAFIMETLAVSGKQPGCVRFIIGDNCITIQAIATRMGLPLVGCASHRINLAIQQHVAEHEALLSQVNELACQLRTKKNAATLLKHTELRPAKRNVTRWSSTFKMARRFLQIKDAAKPVETVEELVPRSRDCRKLEKLHHDLQALDSICVTLPSNNTTLADVCTLFDGVVKRYPEMANYLAKDANTVKRGEGTLSRAQAASIASFQVGDRDSVSTEHASASSVCFATSLLHAGSKRSHGTADAASFEPLLLDVPPTSAGVHFARTHNTLHQSAIAALFSLSHMRKFVFIASITGKYTHHDLLQGQKNIVQRGIV
ncbi:hypothetical protein L917_21410 [Phytophthora nicotianae]|uniref:Uncharacterized protein n=1 Tax=Phytophthora nicotianae TaxID=4792 RepID=W2JXL0_PHYNI|nr:hypothetical protein L917_21410 [Phytophthora nicotianae]